MELKITRDWLAKHRKEDDGLDTSAGTLMLGLSQAHRADGMGLASTAIEGTRDEVSEKLLQFPVGQRFRLIALPILEELGVYARSTQANTYNVRGPGREPAHVSDERSGEYRTKSGEEKEHSEPER